MSEEKNDNGEKTEQPTQYRLDEAFKKGQVALSREVSHWLTLGVCLLIFMSMGPFMGERFLKEFKIYLSTPEGIALNPQGALSLFQNLFFQLLQYILPLALFVIVGSVFGALVQTRLAISLEALMPKFNRLSPMGGVKRIFSKRALIEFLKGLLKLSVVAGSLLFFFRGKFDNLPESLGLIPEKFLVHFFHYATQMIGVVVGCLTLIVILDYAYQKYEFIKSLKMTKEEVKREYKTQEGDPQFKHRRRQVAQQRIKQNLQEAMTRATVVITNPTHYAVVLSYKPEEMDAPRVVAKGVDFLAQTIRVLAEEKKVPIVENPPLARALYSSVKLQQEIPPEHYKAVAEVIRFVMTLRKRAFT